MRGLYPYIIVLSTTGRVSIRYRPQCGYFRRPLSWAFSVSSCCFVAPLTSQRSMTTLSPPWRSYMMIMNHNWSHMTTVMLNPNIHPPNDKAHHTPLLHQETPFMVRTIRIPQIILPTKARSIWMSLPDGMPRITDDTDERIMIHYPTTFHRPPLTGSTHIFQTLTLSFTVTIGYRYI